MGRARVWEELECEKSSSVGRARVLWEELECGKSSSVRKA